MLPDYLICSVTVYLQSAVLFFSRERQVGRDAVHKHVFQPSKKSPNELRMRSWRLICSWFLLAGMRDKQTEAPEHGERRSGTAHRFTWEMYKLCFVSTKNGAAWNKSEGRDDKPSLQVGLFFILISFHALSPGLAKPPRSPRHCHRTNP